MQKAVVRGNRVENVIEIENDAIESYCKVADCELFALSPWGLQKGDIYDGANFYRDGVILPVMAGKTADPDPAEMEAALNELGVQTRE